MPLSKATDEVIDGYRRKSTEPPASAKTIPIFQKSGGYSQSDKIFAEVRETQRQEAKEISKRRNGLA